MHANVPGATPINIRSTKHDEKRMEVVNIHVRYGHATPAIAYKFLTMRSQQQKQQKLWQLLDPNSTPLK